MPTQKREKFGATKAFSDLFFFFFFFVVVVSGVSGADTDTDDDVTERTARNETDVSSNAGL